MLEVIQVAPGRYLGVHHTVAGSRLDVHLVSSGDLRSWRHERVLAKHASMPAIAADPAGGYVVAIEHSSTLGLPPPVILPESISGPARLWTLQKTQLRFLHYASLSALLAGKPDVSLRSRHPVSVAGVDGA